MSEIKNIKKTGERIKEAIKNEEKIILYGDADLDGITSIIILKEAINNLGGKVSSIYIPDRETEGYGITNDALEELKDFAPALFISLDLGIGNLKEIETANQMGFEIIVVDHHVPLEELPPASIIVSPKQKGDNYPFKEFANVGLSLKIAEVLLGDKFSGNLKNSFFELASLGTIFDMMVEEEENKEIIEEGLSALEKTYRPGLRVFFDNSFFRKRYFIEGIRSMAFSIIGVLNSGQSEGNLHETYNMLTCSSTQEARVIMEKLIQKNREKKIRIREITEEVKRKISTKIKNPVFFEGDPFYPFFILGSVATRICKEYKKPVFIYRKNKERSRGSVRSIDGLDSVEAMKKCSSFLISYGGHPNASGFLIKNENLEKFEKCLLNHFKEKNEK